MLGDWGPHVPLGPLLRGKGKWTRTCPGHLCDRSSTGCSPCACKLYWPSQKPFEEGIIILTLEKKKQRHKEIVNELINLIKRIKPRSGIWV